MKSGMTMAPKPKTGPIDEAERWIIRTKNATYRQAAQMFGLSHNSIRARIEHKYGSLTYARRGPSLDTGRVLKPVRRCICCGISSAMDRNQYICNNCKSKNERLHDGWV